MNDASDIQLMIQASIIEQIKLAVPKNQRSKINLDNNLSLTDIGISSMSKIALVYKLEKELSVDLSASHDKVAEIVTIGDVVNFVTNIYTEAHVQ